MRAALIEAKHYWLATVRPDGRPHVVPFAAELSRCSKAKYGYGPSPASYARTGIWCLRPERALGWWSFPRDATRFVFDAD